MARDLTLRDIGLLRKLAPECSALVCSGSGTDYRSILPPVANHYARDAEDFHERLERLSPEETEYLISLVLDGAESLGCVPPDYVKIFVEIVAERVGYEVALSVIAVYKKSLSCISGGLFRNDDPRSRKVLNRLSFATHNNQPRIMGT